MCQFLKITKHALIYVLIFTFILGTFFINPPKAKADFSLGSILSGAGTAVLASNPFTAPFAIGTTVIGTVGGALGVGGSGGTGGAGGTGGFMDSCAEKCPKPTWFWKVDDQIQRALCNVLCAIIGWEAGIVGWVIEKILYPALGLCEAPGTPACPKLEGN